MKGIIIACPKTENADKLRSFFNDNGYPVSGVCSSGSQVLTLCNRMTDGGVIISTYKLADMLSTELVEKLNVSFDMIILLKPGQTLGAISNNILPLPSTAHKSELLNTVEMLVRTASLTDKKKKPAERAPRSEEENEIITRAKQFLIGYYYMSENEAHRFIQKRSMDSGKRLSDTARLILSGR